MRLIVVIKHSGRNTIIRKESVSVNSSVSVTASVVGFVGLPDASSASAIEVFVKSTGLVHSIMSAGLTTLDANGTDWNVAGSTSSATLSSTTSKVQLVVDPALDTNYRVEFLLPSGSTDTVTLDIEAVYTYE